MLSAAAASAAVAGVMMARKAVAKRHGKVVRLAEEKLRIWGRELGIWIGSMVSDMFRHVFFLIWKMTVIITENLLCKWMFQCEFAGE